MESNRVKALLDSHDFDTLYTAFEDKSEEQIADTLLVSAYDDENLLTYTFSNYVLSKEQSSKWHYIASFLMAMAFNHLTYGYQVAYYHALKAVELNPSDVSLKEYILLFYSIPEKLLPEKMAVAFAHDISKVKSDNMVVNMILASSTKT
jgi:hypothetical protein